MNPAPRQHTPGPWDVEPKGSRHFVDGADGLTVAYLDRAGVRERAEIEANALLIAAAPELLAALEDMTDRYARAMKDSGVSHYPEAMVEIRSARAAIAKATGGAA